MAADLAELIAIPDSPRRTRSRSRERLLQDERLARSLQAEENRIFIRMTQGRPAPTVNGSDGHDQLHRRSGSQAVPSSREAGPARMTSNSTACQMGSCGYCINDNARYKEAKPRIDHDYCCSLCRTSGGRRHGNWCQRRPQPSTGSAGANGSHGELVTSTWSAGASGSHVEWHFLQEVLVTSTRSAGASGSQGESRPLQAERSDGSTPSVLVRVMAAPSAARANARVMAAPSAARANARGATKAALGASTATVIHKTAQGSSENAGSQQEECRVCLEKFQDGDALRILPCMHKYHTLCIDKWFRNSSACPICKHSIVES